MTWFSLLAYATHFIHPMKSMSMENKNLQHNEQMNVVLMKQNAWSTDVFVRDIGPIW